MFGIRRMLKQNGPAKGLVVLVTCFTLVFTTVMPITAAAAKIGTAVKHTPPDYFVAKNRIQLDVAVSDPAGIELVRCYFKGAGQADFVFVSMNQTGGGGKELFYSGVLPAPSEATGQIEYLFLVVNNRNQVVKTQSYTINREQKKEVPAWQHAADKNEIQVSMELNQVPKDLPGFTDNIVMNKVESGLRFGVVAGGLYYLTKDNASHTSGAAASPIFFHPIFPAWFPQYLMQKLFFPALCISFLIGVLPARAGSAYNLEAIINRALEANWGMIDARESIHRAELRLDSAESEFELKIYPGASLDFSGGEDQDSEKMYGLSVSLEKKVPFGTRIDLTPSVLKTDDQYQNTVNLQIVQPLLRGAGKGYNLSGIYSARYSERTARRSGYVRAVDTVVSAVRYGYEVIRQQETLRLREESFQRLKNLEETTIIKKRMGLVSAMDLYRVRIQRNQAEEELNQTRESYVDALDTIKIFLALPLESDLEIALPLDFDRIYPDQNEMIQTALANRVELEQARDELVEARRLSDISRNNTLPDLDIGLSVNFTGDPASRFSDSKPDETTWGVTLGSTTDLWRTSEKADYEESLISVQQAARRQRITRDEIVAEVKRELRSLERQDKAITTQKDQIHQSRGQLELARVKFEHGMTDNFDLIDAEIALRRSETQLVSAVIGYIAGQYRLRRAIGTLINQNENDMARPGLEATGKNDATH